MPQVVLVTPSKKHIQGYVSALREGHRCGGAPVATDKEAGDAEEDPGGFLARLAAERFATNGKVPQTTLWLVRGRQFIGEVKIRHCLTPELTRKGGHIAYGIRPSLQGFGYATQALQLALGWAWQNLGLGRVLLTVLASNTASIRVIEKNGGSLVDTRRARGGGQVYRQRYWVSTMPDSAINKPLHNLEELLYSRAVKE